MSKVYEFTVSGTGSFPMDMLRYDCCWPASGEDVSWIESGPERRELMLRSHNAPTTDRWASFMWFVTEIRCNNKRIYPKI